MTNDINDPTIRNLTGPGAIAAPADLAAAYPGCPLAIEASEQQYQRFPQVLFYERMKAERFGFDRFMVENLAGADRALASISPSEPRYALYCKIAAQAHHPDYRAYMKAKLGAM